MFYDLTTYGVKLCCLLICTCMLLNNTGIMDMMKDMYEDGDDNMRKIIGEAMMKSQRGEKPEPPSMNDDL